MNKQSNSEPLWTKNFILLMMSAIFMYISTFMLTPTLPLFARDIGAVDSSVGGFIVFAYTIGCLVPRILWGNLADNWKRKPVYLIGVLIITVISPLFGFFVTVTGILILRLIQGVGFSGSSTTASTIAVDLVPPSRRAEGIGFYTLANTIGMALGPALGLNMLQNFGSLGLFGTSFLAGMISLGIGVFLNYEKKRRLTQSGYDSELETTPDSTESSKSVKSIKKRGVAFEKSVLTTSIVLFFIILPYGGIMAYIASYGNDLGIGEIGAYFSVFAMSLFVVRLIVGKLTDRHGVTGILIISILLMFSGLGVLYWATSLVVFMISAILFGLGFGAAVPLLQTVAFMFCPDDRRGTGSATVFSVSDLAYGCGAVLLGMGIKNFGYEIAFAGTALSVIIGLVLFLTVLQPRIQSHRRIENKIEKE